MVPERFEAVKAKPPQVHPGAPGGVWRTEDACYEFMAQQVTGSSTTLETGLGLSTALFALLGCDHTAVFLEPDEGARFEAWASAFGISLENVKLRPGGSHLVLPMLPPATLDLVFIDGAHGYPMPQLDWLLAASRLSSGGVTVVDDLQLFAVNQLDEFLRRDPRWEELARTPKWVAYRRASSGQLAEEWTAQPFLPSKGVRQSNLRRRARSKVVRLLPQPLKQVLKNISGSRRTGSQCSPSRLPPPTFG